MGQLRALNLKTLLLVATLSSKLEAQLASVASVVSNLNHSLNQSLEEPLHQGFKALAVLEISVVSPLKSACPYPLKMLREVCSQHSLVAIVKAVCLGISTTNNKTLALK